jgi:hypothetical protein
VPRLDPSAHLGEAVPERLSGQHVLHLVEPQVALPHQGTVAGLHLLAAQRPLQARGGRPVRPVEDPDLGLIAARIPVEVHVLVQLLQLVEMLEGPVDV